MKLQSTIELHAGGPGSGRHPDFGKVGKGHNKLSDAKEEARQRREQGDSVKIFKRTGSYTQPHGLGRGITSFRHFVVAPSNTKPEDLR